MKTLYLLRHATAEDAAPPPMGDHERFLSAKGEAEAAAVGAFLEKRAFPDFVLSSTSVRTVQTVRIIYGRLLNREGKRVSSHFDRALYLASAEGLLEAIGDTDDRIKTLLVAAHNPGVAELAQALGRGTLSDHATSFPPAALAVFEINAKSWRGFGADKVRLETVFLP